VQTAGSGIVVGMTPGSSSTVFGITINMGSNTAAAGAGIVFGTGSPTGMVDILGASDQPLIIHAGAAQSLVLGGPGGSNLTANSDGSITPLDGSGMVFSSGGSGYQLGTASNQKLAFWGGTPTAASTGWSVSGSPSGGKAIAGNGSDNAAILSNWAGQLTEWLLSNGILHS
jgi:hypothetical protein